MDLLASINSIKGIGAARASAFEKVGVYELRDILRYFPRNYLDKSVVKRIADTEPFDSCTIIASVKTAPDLRRITGGRTVIKFKVADESGTCDITYFNQPYLKTKFRVGDTYSFYGKFEGNFVKRSLVNPAAEPASVEDGAPKTPIVPVYPLKSGLTQNAVKKAVDAVLDGLGKEILSLPDAIPAHIADRLKLVNYGRAVYALHRPKSMAEVNIARRRMIFEELLTLQLGMLMMKGSRARHTGCVCKAVDMKPYFDSLPFAPTNAQLRCIEQGIADMTSGAPMNRLVQGDVGSGKTAVAAALCYAAIKNGFQTVLLAPTEILATQHYDTLSRQLGGLGISVGLLVGGMKKSAKTALLEELASGKIQLLIGTHAVLEENVAFSRLGLVVCDEQHRFGVEQRSRAAVKGDSPHILVMSATPIPRTLALMMYSDLDLSVLDELPPGRKKTATHVVSEDGRGQVDRFIAGKLEQGKQGYIICPMVEESELTEGLKDVMSFKKELEQKFPNAKIGLVHGRMSGKEKEAQMSLFRSGEMHILVSTTVIEVGVDVPNATYIVIENAERFGLSQLHQLRGRVGRGSEKAYCILVSSSRAQNAIERLRAMESTTDGFELARLDLEMRGPGDFLGNRQSGIPRLEMASLAVDSRELAAAEQVARELFGEDAALTKYPALRAAVEKLFSEKICFN